MASIIPSPIWSVLPNHLKYQLCVIQADMTGDVSHVAAAAALHDNTDILVISSKTDDEETSKLLKYFESAISHATGSLNRKRVHFIGLPSTPQDPNERARGFYTLMTQADKDKRVSSKAVMKVISISSAKAQRLLHDQTAETMNSLLRYGKETMSDVGVYESFGVGAATSLIAEVWWSGTTSEARSDLYTKLATALSYDPAQLRLKDIIESVETEIMQLPQDTGPIILLWARYSGSITSGGTNPEGDSDVKGQQDLATMLSAIPTLPAKPVVITIGHDPSGEHLPVGQKGYHSSYHLGEDFFRKGLVQGKGRGGQLSFFLALMERYPGRLYQIGQKTGAMDAAALVGIPTIYIDHKGSQNSNRMEKWIGPVPHYHRAQVKEPPSVLGKAMRSLERKIKKLKDSGVEGLPSSLQWSDGTKMPRNQWRRIAMLYQGLIKSFPPEKDPIGISIPTVSDPIAIAKACFEAKPAQLAIWDKEIKELTVTQLEQSPRTELFQGYDSEDLETIKKTFVDLVRDYEKNETIIRTADGKYINRKEAGLARDIP